MSLAKKLQLKDGQRVRIMGAPKGLSLDLPTTRSRSAEAVLVFVVSAAELERRVAPLLEAAEADRLAWLAYPKAGQLGTDLNRDILWDRMLAMGVRPVRQVAVDDVWSALRFRPA